MVFAVGSLPHSRRDRDDVIDKAIIDALEKHSFPSIWELTKPACIPTTIVRRDLTP
jgi:hypothetical protein